MAEYSTFGILENDAEANRLLEKMFLNPTSYWYEMTAPMATAYDVVVDKVSEL